MSAVEDNGPVSELKLKGTGLSEILKDLIRV